MDEKTKMVLVAWVPAVVAMIFMAVMSLSNMTGQRDAIAEFASNYMLTEANTQKSGNAVKQDFSAAWSETFNSQASVTVPMMIGLLIALVVGSLFVVNSLTGGLGKIMDGVRTMCNQTTPLSYRIPTEGTNELEPLANQLNGMLERFETVFRRVRDMSVTLEDTSSTLNSNSDQNVANADHLSENMDTVSTAMAQLQSASGDISSNVQTANSEVSDVNEQGQRLTQEVNSLNDQLENLKNVSTASARDVNDLSKQVDGIFSILETIQGIAEQTNLLALNAAIEAARAGEQGRGFAVVADEVRNLAGKTQQSTEEIQTMIGGLKEGAERSIKAMDNNTQATDTLAESLNDSNSKVLELFQRLRAVNDMNSQIATASEEQAQVIENISKLVEEAKSLADNTSSAARSTGNQASSLNSASTTLNETIQDFNYK